MARGMETATTNVKELAQAAGNEAITTGEVNPVIIHRSVKRHQAQKFTGTTMVKGYEAQAHRFTGSGGNSQRNTGAEGNQIHKFVGTCFCCGKTGHKMKDC